MPSPVCRGLLVFVLVAMQVIALGQKQNIRVVVKDSTDRKPIKGASVAIMSRKDSSFLDFGIADTTGRFVLKNVNRATAGALTVSAAGYDDKKVALPLWQGKSRLADTTIELILSPLFVALQGVVVTGTPPIKMNKDTTEFNADYFKTQPNAVLEDLLRKLPGVEIRNGNEVYINGQRVSRITVDGKDFFSEDPVMILKNLPVDIITKVQVANEKNTNSKETRKPIDIPKVINLKLKKEFRKGAFGKLFGGYGTQDRYEAGGLLNLFRDTLQVSFIGSSNNQSRGNDYFQEDNTAFRNVSAGSGGRGITTSHMAGTNVSYVLPNGMQLNGQYTYTQDRSLNGYDNFTRQLLGDTAQLNNSMGNSTSHNAGHRVGLRLRWKQDSTGFLRANVSANWNSSNSNGTTGSRIYSDAVPLLSAQNSYYSDAANRNAITANIDYDKTFQHLKLDWDIHARYSNNQSENERASNSRYIRRTNGLIPDSVIQQQQNNTPNRQLTLSNGLNKNWGKNHTTGWEIEYQNQRQVTGGNTFQFLESTGKNELIPSLSVQLTQYRQYLNNELSYRFNHQEFSLEVGGVGRWLNLKNTYNYDTVPVLQRSFGLLAPQFNINWRGIDFGYDRTLQEPYTDALRPIVDSSNPLSVRIGNPSLRPTKNDLLYLNYNHYFNGAGININLWSEINRSKDAVVTSRQVFTDGKTATGYLNLDGVISYNVGFGISKDYHKKDWDYNTRLGTYFFTNQQPLVLNGTLINTLSARLSPSIDLGANYKNKYRLQGSYRLSINSTRSDDASVQTVNTVQHTLTGSLSLQFTKHFTYVAGANYNVNPRLTPDAKRQWLFADMSMLYTFLKKDRGQLKLTGYDIFNQNQGINQYAYLNYITLNRSLVQRRYFMLTFIYTVRKV